MHNGNSLCRLRFRLQASLLSFRPFVRASRVGGKADLPLDLQACSFAYVVDGDSLRCGSTRKAKPSRPAISHFGRKRPVSFRLNFTPLPTLQSSVIHLPMRMLVLIVGIVALFMGLLWVGQGAGLINWPASSFMIDQRPWITRGSILAVAGLVMIGISRLRR